jgi:hypothetical protein
VTVIIPTSGQFVKCRTPNKKLAKTGLFGYRLRFVNVNRRAR